MDDIQSVLFIVAIPTAAEEERFKCEYLAKNYDSASIEPTDCKSSTTASLSLKAEISKTPTTLTPSISVNSQSNEDENGKDYTMKEVASPPKSVKPPSLAKREENREMPTVLEDIQCDTFPTHFEKLITDAAVTQELNTRSSSNEIDLKLDDISASRKSSEDTKDILSPIKRKKKNVSINLDLSKDICMEVVLKEILKTFHIQNATWTKDAEGLMYQIFFTVEFNETYEKILYNLNEWGIGDREGSTVSVMNCVTSKSFSQQQNDDTDLDFSTENNLDRKQNPWDRFMNSVRSRLNVANIIRNVRQDAAITFDFVILLVSAAILASFGLVEDSTIFLASSMLISPLMGPIIAAIFGTVIKEHSLRGRGLKNECLGILMAVFVGFLFGMIVGATDDRYISGDGLTEEMIARCELHSVMVGIFTAIPSGAAAAIGILGGNIGSLVGVAISASLLPPAVNSGLLWALALIYKVFEEDEARYNNLVKNSIYSTNQATELAIMGSISMCLTISNIICIYIIGILVLKVKEIAPVISVNNRDFWKHDIKIARNLNCNSGDTDAAIMDEFANLPKEDQEALGMNCDFLRNMHIDEAIYQSTWSPTGVRYCYDHLYEPLGDYDYFTENRIEKLYAKARKYSMKEKSLPCYKPELKMARRYTLPSQVNFPLSNVATVEVNERAKVPKIIFDERKRRKFTITPADE